jgi:hypothetical protein
MSYLSYLLVSGIYLLMNPLFEGSSYDCIGDIYQPLTRKVRQFSLDGHVLPEARVRFTESEDRLYGQTFEMRYVKMLDSISLDIL